MNQIDHKILVGLALDRFATVNAAFNQPLSEQTERLHSVA